MSCKHLTAATSHLRLGLPVYKVTNLNDSGTGSFRAGAAAGNCMIVFEVGGTIELLSRLSDCESLSGTALRQMRRVDAMG